jgi:hypothetical protein
VKVQIREDGSALILFRWNVQYLTVFLELRIFLHAIARGK